MMNGIWGGGIEWEFYAQSASKAIFRVRTEHLFCQSLRVDQNGMARSEIWVMERVPQRQIAD